jgi:hypothetical protein
MKEITGQISKAIRAVNVYRDDLEELVSIIEREVGSKVGVQTDRYIYDGFDEFLSSKKEARPRELTISAVDIGAIIADFESNAAPADDGAHPVRDAATGNGLSLAALENTLGSTTDARIIAAMAQFDRGDTGSGGRNTRTIKN